MKWTVYIKIAIGTCLLFSILQCATYYEDWIELSNTSLIVSNKPTVINFYDNYQNDSVYNSKVAVIQIDSGTFTAEKAQISLHRYKFPLLNEELNTLGYARQSFLGKDSSNTFFYFKATDLKGKFIPMALKPMSAAINLTCLKENQTYGYHLYRIYIGGYLANKPNELNGGTDYDTEDLFHILSSKISNDTLGLFAGGANNLHNWEEVKDAQITFDAVNPKKATVNYKFTDFNYVYCLASHIAPFDIVRNVSMLTQDTEISKVSDSVPSIELPNIQRIYDITLNIKPELHYYYVKQQNANSYNLICKYSGDKTPELSMIELCIKYLPESLISLFWNPDEKNFVADASNFKAYFDEFGKLIKRNVNLPENVLNKLNTDFGWYDKFLNAEAVVKNDKNYFAAYFESGTLLYLTEDYKYFDIINENLDKNLRLNDELNNWILFYEGGNTNYKVFPYVEDAENIRYSVVHNTGLVHNFDAFGKYLETFMKTFYIYSLPLSVAALHFSNVPDYRTAYMSVSPNGVSTYTILDKNDATYVYDKTQKLFQLNSLDDLNPLIINAIQSTYPNYTFYQAHLYLINNQLAVDCQLWDFYDMPSLLFDLNGNKIGEVKDITYSIPDNVLQTIQERFGFYDIDSGKKHEIYNQQLYYTVELIDWMTNTRLSAYFNKNRKLICFEES